MICKDQDILTLEKNRKNNLLVHLIEKMLLSIAKIKEIFCKEALKEKKIFTIKNS
jgi:hypothetical protein